ncbi:hypothetical protein GALMADRAFT_144539, partial [Galerina marginata CBS 339.88]
MQSPLSVEDSALSSFFEPVLPNYLFISQRTFREAFAAANRAVDEFPLDALIDYSNALLAVDSPPIIYGTPTADAYIEVYTVWLQFSEFIRSFEFIPSTLRSLMLCPEVPRLPQTFGGLHAVWQYRNVGYKKFQKRITEEEYF